MASCSQLVYAGGVFGYLEESRRKQDIQQEHVVLLEHMSILGDTVLCGVNLAVIAQASVLGHRVWDDVQVLKMPVS